MTKHPPQHCLLIGHAPRDSAKELAGADRSPNIFEGLAAAQKKTYHAIYLVLADIPEPRLQVLETLCRIAPQAKRYLLIEIFEEPEAIRLRRAGNGRLLVTDYFLLPLGRFLPPQISAAVEPFTRRLPAQPDIDAQTRLITELQTLVTQDDLTGLKNRRYLRQFLPAILDSAKENGFQVTLLLFDLDNFKHYNDTYGHSIGDTVLCQTGKLMRRCCREHDVVSRLGGDEFAVIFWDLPKEAQTEDDRRKTNHEHPREAQFMAERFRREMAEAAFECLGTKGQGNLTISGGLATFPHDAQTASELFERADHAMLIAKRTGKNKITIVGQPTQ